MWRTGSQKGRATRKANIFMLQDYNRFAWVRRLVREARVVLAGGSPTHHKAGKKLTDREQDLIFAIMKRHDGTLVIPDNSGWRATVARELASGSEPLLTMKEKGGKLHLRLSKW